MTELSTLIESINTDKNKLKDDYESKISNLIQEIKQLRSQNIFDSHDTTNNIIEEAQVQDLKQENIRLKNLVKEVEQQMSPLQAMIIDL